mmetsp:Transcript_35529/g.33697  ORF Transcript_35529/g.33697 Transcript_35529/m.33697 type:complete len:303 (+) Transcript_35529:51-959(+)
MMIKFVVVIAVISSAMGFNMQMKIEMPSFNKAVCAGLAGLFACGSINMPAHALTKSETMSLTYEQVKGSGLANRCTTVEGVDTIALSGGKQYKITDLCLEPKSWQVQEDALQKGQTEKQFVNTKMMTRQTYTLDSISGKAEVKNGKLVFTEQDGMDYAATTVQMPGGERVPFLFSVKDLIATGTDSTIKPGFGMGGSFTVPSYRTGLFLDPKGRGTVTGYDFAGALPGLQNGYEGVGQEKLFDENNKKFDVLAGDIEFAVSNVNKEEGEFGGVFVSKQPGDTDMGGKKTKNDPFEGNFFWSH